MSAAMTTTEYNAQVAAETSEAAFLGQLRTVAQEYQWLTYHTHNSKRSEPGFPDVVLVRGERVIFAELKTVKGKMTVEQNKWLEALRRAGREVYVWRPVDWAEIHQVLR